MVGTRTGTTRSGGRHAREAEQGSALIPSIPFFQPSFGRFLLVIIGVTAIIAGTWNADRHRHVETMRAELSRLERVRLELERGFIEDRKWYDGLEADLRDLSRSAGHRSSDRRAAR